MRLKKLKKVVSFGISVCLAIPLISGAFSVSETKKENVVSADAAYDDDLVLRYTNSAGTHSTGNAWDNGESFYRAFPLGNGRIGAMVYGNCPTEQIDLNECTVWSSGPGNNNRQGAANYLKQVQDLIASGNAKDANGIIGGKMIGGGQAKYQMVGSLKLSFGHDMVSDYSRQLDMNTATAISTYTFNGKKYKRETFVSYPDQVMVTRITCDKTGSVSLTASYDNVLNGGVATDGNDTLVANGHGSDDLFIPGAVYFSSRSKIINENGTINAGNGKVNVSNADSVMILTSVRTNYVDYKTCNADEKGGALKDISNTASMSFDKLYQNHLKDYQELFKRVDVDLGGDSSVTNKKTIEQRIGEFRTTDDPKMVKTLFQFGRYLMINASRDAQPTNLQGIWNRYSNPAWGSKATTNINYEMNYWPAMTTNLEECFQPFVEKAKSLQIAGNETAKVQYGISEGWVLHHNTDLWNRCAPIDGTWGQWPVGGAWISNMLYDAYRFNQDESYLKEIYPVIKGSASFLNQLMTSAKINGQDYMVISPSCSPEIAMPGNGGDCSYSVTMDNGISRELFDDVVEASQILKCDTKFCSDLQSKLSLIRPNQIGSWGQIQEWYKDVDDRNEKHRHISHLYSLYPGAEITPSGNRTVAEAAKVTLNARGDDGTGWSEAWKLNCWARLGDGAHAYNLIKLLVTPVGSGGRLYDNLWDAHPPFQIDGNFGFTSGVAEMLLQSQNDVIELIPALPKQWNTGHANGLCARGNFEIDQSWANGSLKSVTVLSGSGGVCSLKYGNTTVSFDTEAGKEYKLNGMLQFSDSSELLQNIARNKKATASGEESGEVAKNAFDGNEKTKWCHMDGLGGEWIQVDLGDEYDIQRWVVKFAGVTENIKYNARDFKLQASKNGKDWLDIDTVYGNTKSVCTRNVDTFNAQYVRLYMITSTQSNDGGARVCDLELWGASGEPPEPQSAYTTIEAENFNFVTGEIQIGSSDENDVTEIGYIKDGSFVVYSNVNFDVGANEFKVRASSETEGGSIELRAGGSDGTLLGTCEITSTGGWSDYETFSCEVSKCEGVKDLYLVFKGNDDYLLNVDWFTFIGAKGDIDGNGRVNVLDYIYLKNMIINGKSPSSDISLSNGDLNGDGDVDSSDALILKKYLHGTSK